MCTFGEVRADIFDNKDFCRGGWQHRVLQEFSWSYIWDAMGDLSAVPQEKSMRIFYNIFF